MFVITGVGEHFIRDVGSVENPHSIGLHPLVMTIGGRCGNPIEGGTGVLLKKVLYRESSVETAMHIPQVLLSLLRKHILKAFGATYAMVIKRI